MPTGHANGCAPSIRMATASARAPPARFATAKFSVIVIIIIIVKIILDVLLLILILIMFIHFGISIIIAIISFWLIVVAYVFRHILHNPSVFAIHITTRNLLIFAAVRGPKR